MLFKLIFIIELCVNYKTYNKLCMSKSSISGLLINRLPLWKGQPHKGVKHAPAILESLIREISESKYGMESRFVDGDYLNRGGASQTQRVISDSVDSLLCIRGKGSRLLVNLGGDHAISMGTIPPMIRRYPSLKVIWVDAHADINSPLTSMSGNCHGMPLYYASELSTSHNLSPNCSSYPNLLSPPHFSDPNQGFNNNRSHTYKLPLKNLIYYGLRDLDDIEMKIISDNKIRMYTSDTISIKGSDKIVDEIMGEVGTSPIHLSIDVDGLDPEHCPSTGTKASNGLTLTDVTKLCTKIKGTGNLVSMDLVEFNPLIGSEDDVDNTLDSVRKILESII